MAFIFQTAKRRVVSGLCKKKKNPKDISNLDTFTKKSVYMGTKSHNCIYNNARDMIEKYRKFER